MVISWSNHHILQVNMACYGQKPPDFLALQPNGQIPVAVIDGTVLRCGAGKVISVISHDDVLP